MAIYLIDKIEPKNGAFQGLVDADQTIVDASGFTGNLSVTDTDLQTALATIDGLSIGGGSSLLLDQTTPQTVINGIPVFDLGIHSDLRNIDGSILLDSDNGLLKDTTGATTINFNSQILYNNGNQIFDWANFTFPQQTTNGVLKTSGSNGSISVGTELQFNIQALTAVGAYTSGNADYAVDGILVGDYYYCATANGTAGQIVVFDVSDMTAPTYITAMNLLGKAKAITASADGNYLFVAVTKVSDGYPALEVIDITTKTTPTQIGNAASAVNYDGPNDIVLDTSEGYAYISIQRHTLGYIAIFDVSTRATPTLVLDYETPPFPLDMATTGNYIFLGDNAGVLAYLDITDPEAPVRTYVEAEGGQFTGFTISGNYLYATGAYNTTCLRIWDITTPTSPVLKSRLFLEKTTYSRPYVNGNFVYVAAGGNTIYVIDATDKANPFVNYEYTVPTGTHTMLVVEGDGTNLISNPSTGQVFAYALASVNGVMVNDSVIFPNTKAPNSYSILESTEGKNVKWVNNDIETLLANGNAAATQSLTLTSGTLTAATLTDGTASLTAGSLTGIKLGSLTTNGIVMVSGSDGTLGVDTVGYVPNPASSSTGYLLQFAVDGINATWQAVAFIYDQAATPLKSIDPNLRELWDSLGTSKMADWATATTLKLYADNIEQLDLTGTALYPNGDEGLTLGITGTNRFQSGFFYNTTGTKTASITDGTNAGMFGNGTHAVNLIDGTNAMTMTGPVHPVADEGSILGDGTYRFQSGNFYNTTGTVGAKFTQDSKAGQFTNGTQTVDIVDGTNAITATGNVSITGTLTATSTTTLDTALAGPLVATAGVVSSVTPVADGTYTMGLGTTTNGTITVSNGIITAVTECVN